MEQVIAYMATALIGVGVVSTFIATYASKVSKYINIAKEAIDIIDNLIRAIEDGKVSEEEVEKMMIEVSELKDALKK